MTDETTINGGLSGHREVEISGDNSVKISGLTLKVSDLEQENDKINQQNKEYKQQIEELEDSVKVLSNENDEFKKQVDEVETENKALGAVVARAAELEADVSRLQHDLVSTMSDLQETTAELSDIGSEMVGIKQREEAKDVKLEAIEKERNLLVSKVENLEGVESSMRNELEGKEREICDLKKMISAYEVKERAVVDAVNGGIECDGAVRVGKKGFFGDSSQKDWLLVAGSTISAMVVVGVACYIQHSSRK